VGLTAFPRLQQSHLAYRLLPAACCLLPAASPEHRSRVEPSAADKTLNAKQQKAPLASQAGL
jgi:hypothetical protein